MLKQIHLWLTNHYRIIKYVLLIALGTTLLVFSMIVMAGQNRLITQVKDLSEQNKTLAEDNKRLSKETKKLGEDNQSINKQNRSYTRCIATIFAQYTQDFVPIVINNLDTCTLDSRSQATNDSPVNTAPPPPAPAKTDTPAVSPKRDDQFSKQSNPPPPDNDGIITPAIPIPFTPYRIPPIHIESPF